uniref:Uncharacterized protein n=1 Tax=Arundo donax TaxID=35708 RepID=A0A0A8YE64_ARUDO
MSKRGVNLQSWFSGSHMSTSSNFSYAQSNRLHCLQNPPNFSQTRI